MVYIQVIDVKETFEEIKENKKNNWENIDKQLQPKVREWEFEIIVISHCCN